MRRDLEQRGHDPSAMGFDKPEIQEAHQRAAERAVRWAFLFGAIADGEGIEISDQDVEQRIQAIVEADGRPAAVIRSFFQDEDRLDSLKNTLLERKVIDHVVSAATVEEVEPEVVEQGDG
jgi:trigger factor